MNRKQLERRAYVKPECEIIETSTEQFICTSVKPDADTSTEAEENTEWEEQYNRNTGEFQI